MEKQICGDKQQQNYECLLVASVKHKWEPLFTMIPIHLFEIISLVPGYSYYSRRGFSPKA